jgi:hypothetical protein
LEAIDDAGPVPLGREQFPMEMATIFLSSTRDLHDTPHFVCAALMAEEHRQEFVEIQAIGLRPALAAINFDTG